MGEIRNKHNDGHGRDLKKEEKEIPKEDVKLIVLSILPFINYLIKKFCIEEKIQHLNEISEEQIIWA